MIRVELALSESTMSAPREPVVVIVTATLTLHGLPGDLRPAYDRTALTTALRAADATMDYRELSSRYASRRATHEVIAEEMQLELPLTSEEAALYTQLRQRIINRVHGIITPTGELAADRILGIPQGAPTP